MTDPIFPNFQKSRYLEVRHVGRFAQRLIYGNHTKEDLENILSNCPNLQDLATWSWPIKFLLPILNELTLKRLSADLSDITRHDFLTSTFANITHLEVVKFNGHSWEEWKVLLELPHLSHLIIGCVVGLDIFSNLLRYSSQPQLRILIFMPDYGYLVNLMPDGEWSNHKLLDIDDDRLVLVGSPRYPGLAEDWIKGGESGLNTWTFCELVSLARKRKFIGPITMRFQCHADLHATISHCRKILFG